MRARPVQQWVFVWLAAHGLLACTVKSAIEAPSLRDSSSLAGAPWGIPAGTAGEDPPPRAGMTGSPGGAPSIEAGEGGVGGATGASGMDGIVGAGGGPGAGSDASVPPGDAGDEPDATVKENWPELEHTFGSIALQPGEEWLGLCQSWTVGNEEPLYVNRLRATNEGGFYRSRWLWVDEDTDLGGEGAWPCGDRGFDQIIAEGRGGVFFSQWSHSTEEVQPFPEGVAIELPPRVRIFGELHLFNFLDTSLLTQMRFEIDTLPASEVTQTLQPMFFNNTVLDIAAQGDSRAIMQCQTAQSDFDLYYVLAHFHSAGVVMHLDIGGGPSDGVRLFSSSGGLGEPLGQVLDPPMRVRGATGLNITCEYHNSRDIPLSYGFGEYSGQEMCVAMLYSNGPRVARVGMQGLRTEDIDGVHETEALCVGRTEP